MCVCACTCSFFFLFSHSFTLALPSPKRRTIPRFRTSPLYQIHHQSCGGYIAVCKLLPPFLMSRPKCEGARSLLRRSCVCVCVCGRERERERERESLISKHTLTMRERVREDRGCSVSGLRFAPGRSGKCVFGNRIDGLVFSANTAVLNPPFLSSQEEILPQKLLDSSLE